MVAIPCLALTVLLAKVTFLGGIAAIAILCVPPIETFKVLNLSIQQRSGLREEMKVCVLLYFTSYSAVRHFPFHYILLAVETCTFSFTCLVLLGKKAKTVPATCIFIILH